jgi:hypothetical protein
MSASRFQIKLLFNFLNIFMIHNALFIQSNRNISTKYTPVFFKIQEIYTYYKTVTIRTGTCA